MSPRPGLVLEVERTTPPILFHHGEGFRFEKLPMGSRVVYPNEPLEPMDEWAGLGGLSTCRRAWAISEARP